MKNLSRREISKLEQIEFNIRRIARVLLDLYNPENKISPLTLDYMACALHDQSGELSEVFHKLHDTINGKEGER